MENYLQIYQLTVFRNFNFKNYKYVEKWFNKKQTVNDKMNKIFENYILENFKYKKKC